MRKSTKFAVAAFVAIMLSLIAAPQIAQAASVTYANDVPIPEYSFYNSSTTTVSGGTARTNLSAEVRIYTQTIVPGVGIYASSYADAAGTANLSHLAVGSAQERCFWDYLGGTIAGNPSIKVICTRST